MNTKMSRTSAIKRHLQDPDEPMSKRTKTSPGPKDFQPLDTDATNSSVAKVIATFPGSKSAKTSLEPKKATVPPKSCRIISGYKGEKKLVVDQHILTCVGKSKNSTRLKCEVDDCRYRVYTVDGAIVKHLRHGRNMDGHYHQAIPYRVNAEDYLIRTEKLAIALSDPINLVVDRLYAKANDSLPHLLPIIQLIKNILSKEQ